MKRICLFIIIGFLYCHAFGQELEKVGETSAGDISTIGSVPANTASTVGGVIVPGAYKSCKEIKDYNPDATDGVYTIDPDGDGSGEPFDCYCDMTTDGGGWTLVLLSNAGVSGCPRPFWDEVVNDVNLNGTLSSDITTFDLFLGVKYWNALGTKARLDMGTSPSNLSHRAYYDFSLDEANSYALHMSNESITLHTEGTASPGMYTYHDGRRLSTRDRDQDAYSTGNCSTFYYESAWWYGSCFSGSFWGGGLETYQDAPYWTASGTEYFDYGSIWMR